MEDALAIDWDDPDNTEQVKENVRFLLCGCGCKSGCSIKRCSCCNAGRRCGPVVDAVTVRMSLVSPRC